MNNELINETLRLNENIGLKCSVICQLPHSDNNWSFVKRQNVKMLMISTLKTFYIENIYVYIELSFTIHLGR